MNNFKSILREINKINEGENKNEEEVFIKYRIIIYASNNNIEFKKLDKMEMKEINLIFNYIVEYLTVNLIDKFKEINDSEEDTVVKEKSFFDEYDEEEGYNEVEEDNNNKCTIWEYYTSILNSIIKYSISNLNNSLQESLNCKVVDLIEYVVFNIKYEKENNKTN